MSVSGSIGSGVAIPNPGSAQAIWSQPPWYSALFKASWRGLPFGVQANEYERGRTVAVHRYPYRDDVWPEDLGRAPRKYSVHGFLIENSAIYGGGPVMMQRDAMLAACEQPGSGTLVHPTLGSLVVTLVAPPRMAERADLGRVIEVALEFVEGGQNLFPDLGQNSQNQTQTNAQLLQAAALSDYGRTIIPALNPPIGTQNVTTVVPQLIAAIDVIIGLTAGVLRDATCIWTAVQDIPGPYGRYWLAGAPSIPSSPASLAELQAIAAADRDAVSSAELAAQAAAAGITPEPAVTAAFAAALAQLAAAITATMLNPRDALRLIPELLYYAKGAPAAVVAAAYWRRLVIAALALASSQFQPTSSTEAQIASDDLATLFDAEIELAGDNGDDATYLALRELRAAALDDLFARGGDLAPLVPILTPQPMPALALAQRLYRDGTRVDDLIRRADPIHPAFMPIAFLALAA